MTRETQTRHRFTWSIDMLGNRFAYSFAVAILMNIAFGVEAFSLAVGLTVFLLLTAIVTVGRHRQAGTDRHP